ncbi:MAG: nuclear transport factor 2 family protein [Gemmatimonadales bacterium]
MQTVTSEIMNLEHRFWDAMKAKDAEGATALTDDGCIVVGAQGVSAIDAKSMGKMTAEGKWQLDEYTFNEEKAQIRMLTDDIAIVAYNVKERVEVDGQALSVDANDASVWVRTDGGWRCALHTESLAGDPYGRDKKR